MRQLFFRWMKMSLLGLAWVCSWMSVGSIAVAASDQPTVQTNQLYVEQIQKTGDLAVDDLNAVFAFVFASLDTDVTVYPTENYYYFSFFQAGVRYAGNIRFDVRHRDLGQIHFSYYRDSQVGAAGTVLHKLLGADDGVTVIKSAPLIYGVSYAGKSIIFRLNDVGGRRPPAHHIRDNERLIGPVFDESGVRFFVYYNPAIKVFQFILDEAGPPIDHLVELAGSKHILIGDRTGFAFYVDKYTGRKILIGVAEHEARKNSIFDGPFDQLPDNFIADGRLRDALIDQDPTLRGKIDLYGNFPGGSNRAYIGAYLHYVEPRDLMIFEDCDVAGVSTKEDYYACLSVGTNTQAEPRPRSSAGSTPLGDAR